MLIFSSGGPQVSRLKKEVELGEVRAAAAGLAGLPVMVISGEHDRVVSPRRCGAVAALFPASLMRLIANCGHLPHEESPSNVVILLTQFLGEASPPPRPPPPSSPRRRRVRVSNEESR